MSNPVGTTSDEQDACQGCLHKQPTTLSQAKHAGGARNHAVIAKIGQVESVHHNGLNPSQTDLVE